MHPFPDCNHDTRDEVDNYMTIFFILSTIDKEFSTPVAGLTFRLKKFVMQSVPSLSVLKRIPALGENFLRLSTSFHTVSRRPVACVCRKLQVSLLEQDPIVFR